MFVKIQWMMTCTSISGWEQFSHSKMFCSSFSRCLWTLPGSLTSATTPEAASLQSSAGEEWVPRLQLVLRALSRWGEPEPLLNNSLFIFPADRQKAEGERETDRLLSRRKIAWEDKREPRGADGSLHCITGARFPNDETLMCIDCVTRFVSHNSHLCTCLFACFYCEREPGTVWQIDFQGKSRVWIWKTLSRIPLKAMSRFRYMM